MSRRRPHVTIVVTVTVLGAGSVLSGCWIGTSTTTSASAVQSTGPTAAPADVYGVSPAPAVTSSAAAATPTVGTTKISATTASKAATSAPKAASGRAVLAGRIKPGVQVPGVATWYDGAPGGACLYASGSSDTMTVAMNWYDYETAKACGAYIKVTARNGRSVTVRVTNLCPAPCRVHQLDLSETAFAALADPKTGQLDVTWQLVSPSSIGAMAVRYMTGSSQWWCGIQVIGHRNPVARLEVRAGGSWHALTRADYNHFISPGGAGCGASLRVTDIYAQHLVVPAKPLRPNAIQQTGLQFTRH